MQRNNGYGRRNRIPILAYGARAHDTLVHGKLVDDRQSGCDLNAAGELMSFLPVQLLLLPIAHLPLCLAVVHIYTHEIDVPP
jgi:hypothetical protein